jgi:ATP-dependent Lon protease
MSRVGVVGSVLQLLRLPDGTVKALVEGKQRARISSFTEQDAYFQVALDPIEDVISSDVEIEALMRSTIEGFEQYAKINKNISNELVTKVAAIVDPSKLADTVASHFSFKIEEKQRLLELSDVGKRLSHLLKLIRMEIEVFRMDQRIKGRVKEQMEKTQKNYYLNEQMRAIKKEMGGEVEGGDELKDLEKRIKRKRMSKEAAGKVRQEFRKLKMMTPMSAEATVVRNYVDWLMSLPCTSAPAISWTSPRPRRYWTRITTGLKNPRTEFSNTWPCRLW